MKKYLRLGIFIFLVVLLIQTASCNGSNKNNNVKGSIELNYSARHMLSLSALVEDPDNEVTKGSVQLILYKDDKKQTTQNCTTLPKKDDNGNFESEKVSLTSLKEDTSYTAKLICTIGDSQKTLSEKEVKTSLAGTSKDLPVEISSKADFDRIKEDYSAYYILTQDIDLATTNDGTSSKEEFASLFTGSTKFTGTFDGNGHTVKNFKQTTSREYSGFFGYLSNGATIKDLTLEDVEVSINRYGDTYIGALAGRVDFGVKISNVNVKNFTVNSKISTSSTYSYYYGGLVGYNDGAEINNCEVSGLAIDIETSKVLYAGGFVGLNMNGIVKNCNTVGNITVKQNYTNTSLKKTDEIMQSIGGFAGANKDGAAIEKCSSKARLEASLQLPSSVYDKKTSDDSSETVEKEFKIRTRYNSQLGGFVGLNQGRINSCASQASIKYTSFNCIKAYIGLFCGLNEQKTLFDKVAFINANSSLEVYLDPSEVTNSKEEQAEYKDLRSIVVTAFGYDGMQNGYFEEPNTTNISELATVNYGQSQDDYKSYNFGLELEKIVDSWKN